MKKLSYVFYLVLVAVLVSCGNSQNPQCRKWRLGYNNDNGWTGGHLYCDSLTMVSKTEAIIWIDGAKTKVIAEALFPTTTNCN